MSPPPDLLVQDTLARHPFRSMGTDMVLLGKGDREWAGPFARAARQVEKVFAESNDRFTRFSPDSELSRVNARAGAWTRISEEFAALLRIALDGARTTGGLFDPTVLPALAAAGYDRDFHQIGRTPPVSSGCGSECGGWAAVEIHRDQVRLPPGTALDFGGIAKGWAVDRAEPALAELPWAMVNAGGDLRVFGHPDGGVDVALEDPLDRGQEAGSITLEEGALATSSVACRAWAPGLHHLIDPRTSSPATTGVLQATAWAPTCTEAEVRSKWALLAGPAALNDFPGVLVLEDGRIVTNLLPEDSAVKRAEIEA